MSERRRLPNRRRSETFNFECALLRYSCTASWFDTGEPGEVFLGNHRADSHADSCAKDAATPLDVLRKALLRDEHGKASTPIGVALDVLAAEDKP